MSVVSHILGYILLAITVFLLLVLPIRKLIRNDRGWRKMKADREAQGKPFYGDMEEELEKEKYGIED